MKRIRLERWATQLHPRRPLSRPTCHCSPVSQSYYLQPHNHRRQSTLAAEAPIEPLVSLDTPSNDTPISTRQPRAAKERNSAKLAALHSRLSLPTRFPIATLARTLVHSSADPNPDFNNTSLSILGANLLGYYTTEYLLSHYPRLPMSVVFAAQYAYIGPKALATIASEWGIEAVAEPGPEVDPGLLQFKRLRAGDPYPFPKGKRRGAYLDNWRQSITSRIVYSDEFGSPQSTPQETYTIHPVSLEDAAQSFVRALIGATYLHCGRGTVKRFYANHFLSRHLDLASLFDFRNPTRDLSRLCAREGFDSPIARLESETGRKSRHPVFIVGVYSGKDKLGEGSGSSLDEARVRAAANALKAWYLYRPQDVTVPSSTEGTEGEGFRPNIVDCGEVIV